MFKELLDDAFYKKMQERYSKCLLDYVLLDFDGEYFGAETHKDAVIVAFGVLNLRTRVGNSLNHPVFTIDFDKLMISEKCSAEDFFDIESRCVECYEEFRLAQITRKISYSFAFLDPPYPTGYTEKDFEKLNHLLFPYQNELEIYRWNDDFSNYFDEGKDWWGTGLWSVYDRIMNRFVIIGASLSD